jgi:hypothetical protein
LVRLYSRGVIVGFSFEDDAEAIADVDDSCVLLASFDTYGITGRGEEAKQWLGVLVATVFAPHCAEEPELYMGGFSADFLDYKVIFGPGEGDGVEGFLADWH